MRLKSGLSALPEGLKPTIPTLASTPAIMHASAIGATASSVAVPARDHQPADAVHGDDVGRAGLRIAARSTSPMRWTSPGPA